jgi:hypothetical protein
MLGMVLSWRIQGMATAIPCHHGPPPLQNILASKVCERRLLKNLHEESLLFFFDKGFTLLILKANRVLHEFTDKSHKTLGIPALRIKETHAEYRKERGSWGHHKIQKTLIEKKKAVQLATRDSFWDHMKSSSIVGFLISDWNRSSHARTCTSLSSKMDCSAPPSRMRQCYKVEEDFM